MRFTAAATMLACSLLVLLLAVVPGASAAPPAIIKLGAVLPLTGPLLGAGFRSWMILNLSIAEIHTNLPGVLNGTQVQLVVADSLGTKSGILRATRALASQGVAAIIGGVEATNLLSNHAGYVRTDTQGVGVGVGTADVSTLVWAANSLPEPLNVMLTSSSACQSAVFNDRGLFPYMNRMCTKLTAKAKAMLAASNAFGWKKIAVIAQDTSDGYGQNSFSAADPIGETLAPGQSEPDYLVSEIAKLNGEEAMKKDLLRIRLPSVTSAAIEQIPARLQQLKESGFRIIAVYLQGDMLVKFMRLAHAADMLRAPYVWVGAGSFAGPSSTMGVGTGAVASGGPGPGLCSSYMRQTMADLTPSVPSIDSSAGELISTYQSSNIGAASSAASYVYQVDLAMTSSPLLGVICFSPSAPRTPAFTNLRYRLGAAGLTMESVLGSNDATLYDSVLIHAKAFDSLIQSGATLTSSGIWSASDVNSAIKSVTTSSTSGTLDRNIRFDPKGDRYGSIDLFNYDPYGSSTGSFVRRGVWSEYSGNLTIDDALIWSDGTTSLPPDHVDQFTVGQVMPFSFDQRILAVAYFFVLLPSLMLVYNGRRLARMFLEAYSIPSATGEISTEWRFLAARSFALFSLPAVFAMIYLNILAIVFESGSFRVETGLFVGQIFLAFVAMVCIVPVPLLTEMWYHSKKGGSVAQDQMEDFELHLHDGEEIVKEGQQNVTTAKDAADKKLGAASSKAASRKLKRDAKTGKLVRSDEAGFIERELSMIWEKTTPGLAMTSALLAALNSGLFYLIVESLVLPMEKEINEGKAFGVWILEFIVLHACLVRVFKDSRNMARVIGAFLLSAALLMSFHANMSCVTFRWTNVLPTVTDGTIDLGGVAIAHAIFFAIPFFIGLHQLIKALKLSRHSLDAVLNGLKAKLAALESSLEQAKVDRKAAAADADHLKRLLELSNLCRPLHRNHALAFTMAETTNTGASDATISKGPEKQFVPASFTTDAVTKPTGSASSSPMPSRGINAPGTPQQRGLAIKVPSNAAGGNAPAGSPDGSSTPIGAGGIGISTIRLGGDGAPGSPSMGGRDSPFGTPAAKKGSFGINNAMANPNSSPMLQAGQMSQGLQSTLTGLDFGFLARPKAEMTGYKLLNELSLELFLASGPVHHRAVADIHLSHILSHPLTIELFKDSFTRSGSQETLAFWLDIQRFKQLEEDALRRQIAEAMCSTFLYSDAPHPVTLTPASREGLLNIIFAKKAIKSSTFHFVEQELVVAMQKDFANFVTSTGFKVCAFLLGHSSYRPSTRIKTLNPGGAAVGDGGKMVPLTQNQGPLSGKDNEHSGSGAATQAGAGGANDDPHSSVASAFVPRSPAAGTGADAKSRISTAGGAQVAGAGFSQTKSPKVKVSNLASPSGGNSGGIPSSPAPTKKSPLGAARRVDAAAPASPKGATFKKSTADSNQQAKVTPKSNAAAAAAANLLVGLALDDAPDASSDGAVIPQLVRSDSDLLFSSPALDGADAEGADEEKEESTSDNGAEAEKQPLSPGPASRPL